MTDYTRNRKLSKAVLLTPIPDGFEAPTSDVRGYCYLLLFDKDYHREISYILGPYPTWATLKTYGAAQATGSYRLIRQNGYAHILTGGTGYSIRDLPIRDDEMIGGLPTTKTTNLGAILRLFSILIMVLATPAYGRRRSSTDSVMIRLLEKHPDLEIPEDFPSVYQDYLKGFRVDLPANYMCIESYDVRDYLLDLPWTDDEVMTLIGIICPTVADSGVTFTELDMFLERNPKWEPAGEKNLSDRVHSAVSRITDDANYILDTVPSVHEMSRRAVVKTTRVIGGVAESIVDGLVDTTATATTLAIDHTRNAAEQAINIVDKTAATVVDHTVKTVHSGLTVIDEQAGKARDAAGQCVNVMDDILWHTVGTATNQARLHREFMSNVLEQTVALGNELFNPIKDPAEAARRFKSKQRSLNDYGDLLGDSVSTLTNDIITATKTLYASGEALLKGVYDNSYSGEEVASKIMNPAKDLTDNIVPTITVTSKAIYRNWRGYLDESKEAFTTIIDGVPWASNRLGATIGGFASGLFTELGIKETPSWFGSLRTQLFGKPPNENNNYAYG